MHGCYGGRRRDADRSDHELQVSPDLLASASIHRGGNSLPHPGARFVGCKSASAATYMLPLSAGKFGSVEGEYCRRAFPCGIPSAKPHDRSTEQRPPEWQRQDVSDQEQDEKAGIQNMHRFKIVFLNEERPRSSMPAKATRRIETDESYDGAPGQSELCWTSTTRYPLANGHSAGSTRSQGSSRKSRK